MKIVDKILGFKTEIEICGGKIIRITLDEEGRTALRREFRGWLDGDMVFGIIIDKVEECPTSGQEMKEKR